MPLYWCALSSQTTVYAASKKVLIPTTRWDKSYTKYGLKKEWWYSSGTHYYPGQINGNPGYYVSTYTINNTRTKTYFLVWEMNVDCIDDGASIKNSQTAYIKILAGNGGIDICKNGSSPVISATLSNSNADLITEAEYTSSVKSGSAQAIIETAIGCTDWLTLPSSSISIMNSVYTNSFKNSYTSDEYPARYNKGATYSKKASIGLGRSVLNYTGHKLKLKTHTQLPSSKYRPKVYKKATAKSSRQITYRYSFTISCKKAKTVTLSKTFYYK